MGCRIAEGGVGVLGVRGMDAFMLSYGVARVDVRDLEMALGQGASVKGLGFELSKKPSSLPLSPMYWALDGVPTASLLTLSPLCLCFRLSPLPVAQHTPPERTGSHIPNLALHPQARFSLVGGVSCGRRAVRRQREGPSGCLAIREDPALSKKISPRSTREDEGLLQCQR